jgi:hypothetical protein
MKRYMYIYVAFMYIYFIIDCKIDYKINIFFLLQKNSIQTIN